MKITEAENNYVFTTTIKVFGEEWIKVREPNFVEFQKLQTINPEDTDKLGEELLALLPKCIVDSSFENEDGTACNGNQIYELLAKSAIGLSETVSEWVKACPFTQASENTKN